MTAVDGNSSYYLDVAVTSIPVAGASTVACTTALFVLMYFKMYRHFTYRLVLYTLVMATLSSLLLIAIMAMEIRYLLNDGSYVHEQPEKGPDYALYKIFLYIENSSFISMWVLTSCISFSIYNMVVHNHLFKTWESDLKCLLLSLVTPIILLAVLAVVCNGDKQVASSLECVSGQRCTNKLSSGFNSHINDLHSHKRCVSSHQHCVYVL